MIDELHVRDVALIRDATIEPATGLTVLTGETGAGKTALLSSIKLLVGERSDAGMVREGSAALEVEGRLFLRGDDEDGTVVRRRVSTDGRGRVELNGHMASVRELADRVGSTVDLCGQHEHQRLLSVQTHAEMLDMWAGAPAAEALEVYRDALSAAGEAAAELERVREMGRATGEKLDEAVFVLRRIDEVDPREGELEELEAQLPRVEHGEALMSAALGARERLAGDDGALHPDAEHSSREAHAVVAVHHRNAEMRRDADPSLLCQTDHRRVVGLQMVFLGDLDVRAPLLCEAPQLVERLHRLVLIF